MNNFVFQNPTKLIFGEGQIARLAKELPKDKRILVTFGGGSVKHNGVYDQVVAALSGFDFLEFWGIEPNPKVETLRKAVAVCKRENVGFLLAVGGGSVLDGTKLIAAAAVIEEDAWDLVLHPELLRGNIPFASVMTLPATGSEMNRGCVISNLATGENMPSTTPIPHSPSSTPQRPTRCPPSSVRVALPTPSCTSSSSTSPPRVFRP